MQDEVRSDQSQRYIYASIYGCHRFLSVAVALPNVDDISFLFLTAVYGVHRRSQVGRDCGGRGRRGRRRRRWARGRTWSHLREMKREARRGRGRGRGLWQSGKRRRRRRRRVKTSRVAMGLVLADSESTF